MLGSVLRRAHAREPSSRRVRACGRRLSNGRNVLRASQPASRPWLAACTLLCRPRRVARSGRSSRRRQEDGDVIARTTWGRALAVWVSVGVSQVAVPVAYAAAPAPAGSHLVDQSQVARRLLESARTRDERVALFQAALGDGRGAPEGALAGRRPRPVARGRAAPQRPRAGRPGVARGAGRAGRGRGPPPRRTARSAWSSSACCCSWPASPCWRRSPASHDDWDDWDDDCDCW